MNCICRWRARPRFIYLFLYTRRVFGVFMFDFKMKLWFIWRRNTSHLDSLMNASYWRSRYLRRKIDLDPFFQSNFRCFLITFSAPIRMNVNFWKISLMRCPVRLGLVWPIGYSRNLASTRISANWRWSRSRCDSDGRHNWRWLRAINMAMRSTCRIWRSK